MRGSASNSEANPRNFTNVFISNCLLDSFDSFLALPKLFRT
jgi:hypothetical protein